MRQCSVVIAEHSPLLRAGLKQFFSESTSFELVGIYAEVSALMKQLPLKRPRIAIINPLQLEYSKRLMLRQQFQDYPHLRIVALHTGYVEAAVLSQFHAVIDLDDKFTRMENKLSEAVCAMKEEKEDRLACELSERETEVLKSICRGATNKKAAEELHLSVHTIITHRKNISRKTGVKTLSGLTLYALLNHLVDENEIQ